MKRFISFVLTMVLLLSLIPSSLFSIKANAATSSSGTCGENLTWTLEDYTLTISGTGPMTNFTSAREAPWYYYRDSIIFVKIGDGVTSVGDYAFYGYSYGMSGGRDVTSIGKYAFYNCKDSNAMIPDNVTSIGDYAFASCSYLTSLTIGKNVTQIGYGSFSNCTSLNKVYFNATNCTSMGGYGSESAFYGCTSLATVNIGNNVTSIPGNAFPECSSLTSVTIPDSVTSIGYWAFHGCTGLIDITIPDSVTHIRRQAFEGCTGLIDITIPDSVTNIGDRAFQGCTGLTSVTIGSNITAISNGAFKGCTGLIDITIPDSVTYIGDRAFDDCKSLSTVTYDGVIEQWNKILIGSGNDALTSADLLHKCQTGHSIIEATCTTPEICRVCGYTWGEMRGHSWDTNTGTSRNCTVCNFTEGDALPEYTITYHLDGGTNALKNPDVYTSEDVITLRDASKVGYDFAGWFLDSNKTEQISFICGTCNINVYAKFIPKGYTATYQDGVILTLKIDGYADKKIYVAYGMTVDPYSKEFMSEYISPLYSWLYTENSSSDPYFSGWYVVNKDGTKTKLGNLLTLTSNTTLYCDFNLKNEDDVPSYDSNVGIQSMFSGKPQNSICGQNGRRSYVRVPTLSGGFYLQISLTLGYSSSHGSVTVYNETKGEEVKFLSVSYGDYGKTYTGTRVFYRANPGDILCIFTDWAASYEVVFDSPVRTSSTITSSKTTTKAVYYDQDIANPTPTNKNGYDFLGWYDLDGNRINNTWEYTDDQTFVPKWQPTKYYISYNLNDGTNSPANPSSYTVENSIVLSEPTKPGYTFKGWYSDANFTTQVTSISKKTGNITLYAKWEANSYNLTLDANNGVFAPKVTFISDGVEIKSCYLYGQDTITAYRPDNKDGYIFAGWYNNDTFTSIFKFNGTITNDITLYAKWIECNSSMINIESSGKVNATIQGKAEQLFAFAPLVDGKITVTSESNNLDLYGILYDASKNVLISADDISATDLDFTYTYSVKAGQLYYIAVKGNTASTTGQAAVNIVWTGNCAITGTTYQNKQFTIAYDANYKLPQNPIREGYVFLGWFDENNTQITDGTWNFVSDKTLTAKWKEITRHTVVFKDFAGNIISSEVYYFGEEIAAPELPIKAPDETYIYHTKWNNGYTGICTGDAVYSPTFDMEFIEYTIVFEDEDGTEISRATYHWGDEIKFPADPIKAADSTYTYTFAGWNQDVTHCCGNATYTATYTKQPITFHKVHQWNVTLEEDFKVNFHLVISDDIAGKAKIRIMVGDEMVTYQVSKLEKNAEGYYVLTVAVSAAQMNDAIMVMIMNGNTVAFTETYTIREYCDVILADESYSSYHALVKEMLHYGAMSQVCFDYDAENLANDGITDTANADVPETVEDIVIGDKISGLNFYGASLVFRDRIAVRYYFTGDVTGCTFTTNGNTYTPVAKEGMYYVEIADILPQNIDQQITMTVIDASGKNLSVTYGPMNYIVRMNEKGSETLQNLVKALYNYHLAAKTLQETV